MNWVLKNIFTGESIFINNNQFTIGRDKDYDLVCKSTLVSRLHAKIFTLSNGNLQIVNYSNSNGTYINNKKIFDKELEENDEIGFGLHRLDSFHENYQPPYYIFKLQQLINEPIINIESDNDEQKHAINIKKGKLAAKDESQKKASSETTDNSISPKTCKHSNKDIKILDKQLIETKDDEKVGNNNLINVSKDGEEINTKVNIYTAKTTTIQMQKNDSSKEFVDNNKNVYKVNNKKNELANDKININLKKISNKTVEANKTNDTSKKKDRAIMETQTSKKRAQINKDSLIGIKKKKNLNKKFPFQKELKIVLKKLDNKMKGELEVNNENVSINNGTDRWKIMDIDELEGQNKKITHVSEKTSTSTMNNKTTNTSYSCDDNIIVIDDNAEDNFEFVCSQLFVKSEPLDKISDELFDNIKKEVAEMDDYDDISRMPAIIITESDNDEDELLKQLDDAIEDKGSETLLSNINIAPEAPEKISDNLQPSTSGLQNNKKATPIARNEKSRKTQIIEAQPLITPMKRKNKIPPENKSTKKTKTNENNKSKSKTSRQNVCSNDEKLDRKQKLKKLAEKEAATKQPKQTETTSKANTRNKIKVSSGRGGFLLEQNQENKPTSLKSASRHLRSNSTVDILDNSPIALPMSFNNDGGSFRVPPIPNINASYSLLNYNTYRSKLNQTQYLLEEYWDIIEPMFNWNINWFKEYTVLRTPPPVTKKPVIKMCNTFSSFNDYRSVLEPLMILNYWFTIANTFQRTDFYGKDNERRHTVVGIIEKLELKERNTELLCTTYITAEQNMYSDHIKEKSFVLVNVGIKGDKKYYRTLFGVVSWITKEKLTRNDKIDPYTSSKCKTIPTTKLRFLLMVKKCDSILMNLHVCVRYFNDYSFLLKLISAVRSLGNSPLLSHILEPKINDYYIPFDKHHELTLKRELNEVQLEAVVEAKHLALKKNFGVYLIEGPPGTGKSTVIQTILTELLLNNPNNECVLLLAPSNGAIDSITNTFLTKIKRMLSEIDRNRIKLVRVGVRISGELKPYSLDYLAAYNLRETFLNEHPQAKNDFKILQKDIRILKAEMEEKPSRDIKSKLNEKLLELENFAKNYLKYKYSEKLEEQKLIVLQKATVICSTIGSANNIFMRGLNKINIKVCIIDEATQCSEPESLIPIKMGVKKLILVGDPQQLPAVTSSTMSKEFGYDKSLFSRIKLSLVKGTLNPIKLLNVQYRMNPEINSFPNRKFYNGEVKNSPNFIVKKGLEKLIPYIVFDRSQPFTSDHYYNNYEVKYIILLIQAILDNVKIESKLSIGIITPYTKQREAIISTLKEQSYFRDPNVGITCNTVDSFQGQEKDIIILSTVRNAPNLFSQDLQRLNVALTRAKYALYIIGSKNLFDACNVLKELKEDAKARKFYHSLTEEINSPAGFSKLITKY